MTTNEYLSNILLKYQSKSIDIVKQTELVTILKWRANTCLIDICLSWSVAKGTAISLSSDLDYFISLSHNCNEDNWGLNSIFNSLYYELQTRFWNVRKQNVSCRINFYWLEIDITPARKLPWNTNDHIIYISKTNTRQKTNIQKHINDIYNSWRRNEIKLLKIRRELHGLDFPSIYLEYLVIDYLLLNKSKNSEALWNNFYHILQELSKTDWNFLFTRVVDPANSNNLLSDLLNTTEKNKIISEAKNSVNKNYWSEIIR